MTDILYTLFHLQGKQDWQPPVNVFESENEFLIEMELAGIEKEQIRVVFEEGVLSISGTRKRCPQTRRYICCQLEMEYGNFYRFIRFDAPVVETEIDARCDKGILTIHVPKRKNYGEDITIAKG